MKIKISITQLEALLNEQKRLVCERLLRHSYLFNPESTEGNLKSMEINKDAFVGIANEANYPKDVEVLKRYIE